jgi:pimeloyl-ACP methyl ester carboxylesterase
MQRSVDCTGSFALSAGDGLLEDMYDENKGLVMETEDCEWKNEVPARAILVLRKGFSALESASSITCPILFSAVRDDPWTPEDIVQQAFDACPSTNKDVIFLEHGSHFSVYYGENLELTLQRTIEFFEKHLQ